MSNAEAKALGLLAGNAAGTDGWVGFNSAVTYTFDPNSRAVAGAFDFFGIASHEVTEVMGRYGFGQNGAGGRDAPIDLFRFFSPGVRDLSPAFGGGANYFSIDGGVTSINTFNTVCCGDLSDWAGQTVDAYNAFLARGMILPTSAGDLTEMDVLGYDRTAPEPATATLVAVGLAVCFAIRRRRLFSKPSERRTRASRGRRSGEARGHSLGSLRGLASFPPRAHARNPSPSSNQVAVVVRETEGLDMAEVRTARADAATSDAALDVGEGVAPPPLTGSHWPSIVPRVESLA